MTVKMSKVVLMTWLMGIFFTVRRVVSVPPNRGFYFILLFNHLRFYFLQREGFVLYYPVNLSIHH